MGVDVFDLLSTLSRARGCEGWVGALLEPTSAKFNEEVLQRFSGTLATVKWRINS